MAENYVSIFSIGSMLFGVLVFCRKWIVDTIHSIHIGNRFRNVFGNNPVDKIKETHDKLNEANNKLSIRLDIHERYLSIGLFICEPKEGSCVWTNDYLNSLFDMDSKDMLGFGWLAGVDPNDKERVFKTWLFSVSTKTPFECEYHIINEAKVRTKVIAHSIAAINENKEIVCYVGYITECK